MTELEACKIYFQANRTAKRTLEMLKGWDPGKSPKENSLEMDIDHQTALNLANRFDLYKLKKN